MEFRLLGPVEIVESGDALPLGGPKQRALLALLLLSANKPLSRDALVDGLWGSSPPRSAAHMVDDYVSRLRKLLGPARIVRQAPGYRIVVTAGELDVDRFVEAAREGRRALGEGRHTDARALLRHALSLWRGAALADVLYEPFASIEAERLEDMRVAAFEERVEAELALGAGADLVVELEEAILRHPLRERLVGHLMVALYRAGRQTAALEAYRLLRHMLSEELGLEPARSLQMLERRILEHDPALAVTEQRRELATRRRRAIFALAGAAAAAVAAALVLVAIRGGSSVSAQPSQNQLVQLSDTGRVQRTVALGEAPAAAVSGPSSLWVADPSGHELLRTNAATGIVVDRVPLPSAPGDIAVGGGSIWVTDTGDPSLRRVDLTTDGITERTPLPSPAAGIAVGAGAVWVGDPVDKTLLRIDPGTGDILRTFTIGVSPSAIAVAFGSIWIASFDDDTVVAVDPASGATTVALNVGGGPTALAVAAGSVWVADELDGTVARIDPRTESVTNTIPTGSWPSALAATSRAVWVSNEDSGTVSRIDTRTTRVTRTISVGGDPTAVAATRYTVWVGTHATVSHRGGTLVLDDTRRFLSIDPQIDEEAPNAQFFGMVNDTLVTWDHTPGPDGLHLVPDLALRVPLPSSADRTYVFTLRPGLVYSTGAPVRASDFKRSIRRLFRVHSPSAPFFRDITRILADDGTRTITFRLSRPDPDFLPKLAVGAVIPIPAGTPMHDVGTHPIPGTGPYEWAKVGEHEIEFVRNPRFHEWSHAAQPDGEPDTIVWHFGKSPQQEVRDVLDGKADWTSDAPADIGAIARRRPALVHADPTPTAFFFQLNTHEAPFDDVRVRRALNDAVDRREAVRLLGGPLFNTPLCQTIAPGLPGHESYCPYTDDPNAAGIWRRPDLPRARALVKASRTRGDRVTITDVSDTGTAEPIAAYLQRLLQRLGYRARVRVLTSAQMSKEPPSFRRSIQVQPFSWGPDFPSAAGVLGLLVACNGAFNPGLYCSPSVDRRMAAAESLRATEPELSEHLWAQIDRQLTSAAVWVPLVDQDVVDVVSARVRNYEFSPVYLFLTDQVWLR